VKITRAPSCKCAGQGDPLRLDTGHVVVGFPCPDCGQLAILLSGPVEELITELISVHEAELTPARAAAAPAAAGPGDATAAGGADPVADKFGRWLARTPHIEPPPRPADNTRHGSLA
jgi:predicted RNA-binding Zn-ribbon protein involved in translation (DUF1610 family)